MPHLQSYRVSRPVDQPVERLAEVLSTRPTTWIRSYLRLASFQPPGPCRPPALRPWYRLGPAERAGEGVTVPLVWWPHGRHQLFTSFTGHLTAGSSPAGTVLSLEGEADGGEAEHNDLVLGRLLGLLADAPATATGTAGSSGATPPQAPGSPVGCP